MSNSSIRFYPLWVIVPYILFGLFSSIWGAFEYEGYNKEPVLIYVIAFLVLFCIGYWGGVSANIPKSSLFATEQKKRIIISVFKLFCLISFGFMSFELLATGSSNGFNFSLSGAGDAYVNSYDGNVRNSGSYSIRFLLSSIAAFPVFVTVIWGVYFFRDINLSWKLAIIYVIVTTIVVYTIGGGKQKQLGDLLIYFVAIWGVTMAAKNKIRFKSVLLISFLMLIGIALMLTMLGSRYAAIGVNADTINSGIHELIYFNQDSYIMQIFGQNLGFAVSMLSGYLGQGYYGLSLALEQDFTWTAFGGSSYSVSVILNQFFGLPFLVEQSYPYLVGDNTGWAETKWHSVFAWLASDFTFPGTLVLFTAIAFVYGRAWKEAILVGNPFSVLLFCLLSVGIIYIPANNQLMHSPGGLLTLFGTLLLYFVYHRSFNFLADEPEHETE